MAARTATGFSPTWSAGSRPCPIMSDSCGCRPSFSDVWELHARAYYTAVALGILNDIHPPDLRRNPQRGAKPRNHGRGPQLLHRAGGERAGLRPALPILHGPVRDPALARHAGAVWPPGSARPDRERQVPGQRPRRREATRGSSKSLTPSSPASTRRPEADRPGPRPPASGARSRPALRPRCGSRCGR